MYIKVIVSKRDADNNFTRYHQAALHISIHPREQMSIVDIAALSSSFEEVTAAGPPQQLILIHVESVDEEKGTGAYTTGSKNLNLVYAIA